MISQGLLGRLDPYRETQTVSIRPSELAELKQGDEAISHGRRIVFVEMAEKRMSRTLPTFKGTFRYSEP
jgi:hypothetical protein